MTPIGVIATPHRYEYLQRIDDEARKRSELEEAEECKRRLCEQQLEEDEYLERDSCEQQLKGWLENPSDSQNSCQPILNICVARGQVPECWD